MKIKWLLFAGTLSALAAAVVLMPATVIENAVNVRLKTTGLGALRVSGGTIWSGAATLTINTLPHPGQRAGTALIPLTWSFAPSGLLALRVAFDIHADSQPVRGTARIGAGLTNLAISRADLTMPLEFIARFNRNLSALRASGEVILRAHNDTLTIGYSAPITATGSLRVSVKQLRLRTLAPEPFGSYEAALLFAGQNIRYQIDQSSGMLQLKGEGAVAMAAPKQFRYTGTAAAKNAPPWLTAALQLAGRPSLDGRYQIDYKSGF